jgi:hypothetical protein
LGSGRLGYVRLAARVLGLRGVLSVDHVQREEEEVPSAAAPEPTHEYKSPHPKPEPTHEYKSPHPKPEPTHEYER